MPQVDVGGLKEGEGLLFNIVFTLLNGKWQRHRMTTFQTVRHSWDAVLMVTMETIRSRLIDRQKSTRERERETSGVLWLQDT